MKKVFWLTVVLISTASVFAAGFYMGKKSAALPAINTYGDFTAKVERMKDGDTLAFEIFGEEETVRYIGIDTPETKHPDKGVECFGPEAAERSKELVLGKQIYFERDNKNRDHHGRLVRYVWAGKEMINEKLVREGFAFASHVSPNGKYKKIFEKAEAEAREAGKGLWSACKTMAAERISSRNEKRQKRLR